MSRDEYTGVLMIYFLSNIYRRTLLDAALWRKQTMIKEMEKRNNEQIRYATNNTNSLRMQTKDYWL